MAVSFTCECGKSLQTKEEFAGQRTRCPSCGAVQVIPAPAEPEAMEPWTQDTIPLAPEPRSEPARAGGPRLRFEDPPSAWRAAPAGLRREAPLQTDRPEPITSGFSPREYLYWLLVVALVPLALSVLQPKDVSVEDRIAQTLQHASPEVRDRINGLAASHELTPDELIGALPGGRIDGALLPRDTSVHWAYAALAAVAFWAMVLSLFPNEKKRASHLFLVGLFTGTIGIIFLLVVQFLAAATQGVWVRGGGVFAVLFYVAKFIGFSYASANDPDSNFALSLLGFICGVGLCEELCKALPLIVHFRRGGAWAGGVPAPGAWRRGSGSASPRRSCTRPTTTTASARRASTSSASSRA
jgi:hypothetical protein